MGQYWKPVNLDKRETLNAHQLGDGCKLWEIAANGACVAGAMVLLLAPLPEKRGNGDPTPNSEILGRWAGDRIVMVGDYSEDADMPGVQKFGGLYTSELTDISDLVAPYMQSEFDE